MLSNLNSEGIYLKVVFDGYDFLNTEIGKILVSNKELITKLTYSTNYKGWKEFLDYCKQPISYINNLEGYYTGIYKLNQSKDNNNPWKDREYILFNNKALEKIYSKCPYIKNLEFYVCPSFNEDGQCDGIGFRIINSNLVQNAFKWLFMSGNNIIYGKDTVNTFNTCYIVEGFRDYIALKESGYNVIGLGSVFISKQQEEYINRLYDPILLLDKDKFGLQQSLNYMNKYRIATLIQTTEKDAWDTYSKGIPIKIVEIR